MAKRTCVCMGYLSVCVSWVRVCLRGKDGWCYCVSREVHVFALGGAVCRSRRSLLGWSGLRKGEGGLPVSGQGFIFRL